MAQGYDETTSAILDETVRTFDRGSPSRDPAISRLRAFRRDGLYVEGVLRGWQLQAPSRSCCHDDRASQDTLRGNLRYDRCGCLIYASFKAPSARSFSSRLGDVLALTTLPASSVEIIAQKTINATMSMESKPTRHLRTMVYSSILRYDPGSSPARTQP